MTYVLYNAMKQPIKHRGQLSKGDLVHFSDDWTRMFRVIQLKDNIAEIKLKHSSYCYFIQFVEGTGWGWGVEYDVLNT